MKINKPLLISFSLLVVLSLTYCKRKDADENKEKEIIVEAYGEKLTKAEIIKHFPVNLSKEDSIAFTDQYIQKWINERLFYNEAKLKLKDTVDIQRKIHEYRKKLYIQKYQETYILPQVNKNVSKSEIEEYYNKYLNNYILNQTYVKAHYITISAQIATYYDVLQTIQNSGLEDEKMLQEYCIGTDREIFFQKEWIPIDELNGIINYPGVINENEIQNNSILDYVYEDKRYIVKIDEYVLKGSVMPLEIAQPIIYKSIVDKRKETEQKRILEELLKNAESSGDIKFYYD